MINYAIFEIVAVILAIPMSYAMARVVQYYSRPNYRNDIDTDFQKEWNGKPEDEYYAWIRVRRRYLYQDSPAKHLRHINERLASVNKRSNLSNVLVDDKGELRVAKGERHFRSPESDSD